ncbi:hypothetical protein BJ742DRAFT_776587 [Cladochytrium replicatum]|nr:hypothetical protein BJ742DRAFT_776587 [Cladochytrium replicatum]
MLDDDDYDRNAFIGEDRVPPRCVQPGSTANVFQPRNWTPLHRARSIWAGMFALRVSRRRGRLRNRVVLILGSYRLPRHYQELVNSMEQKLHVYSGDRLCDDHRPIASLFASLWRGDIASPQLGKLNADVAALILKHVKGNTFLALEQMNWSRFLGTWGALQAMALHQGLIHARRCANRVLFGKAAYCCFESRNYRRMYAAVSWLVQDAEISRCDLRSNNALRAPRILKSRRHVDSLVELYFAGDLESEGTERPLEDLKNRVMDFVGATELGPQVERWLVSKGRQQSLR